MKSSGAAACRAYQFFTVCEALGCKARLIPCPEKPNLENLGWIDLSEFDHIVTHGEKGEYGHPHHVQVHRHVRKNAQEAWLTFFGYGLGRHIIDLNAEETERKYAAFRKYSYRRFHKGREITQCEALIDIHYTGNIPMNRETYDGDWPFP